MISVTAFEVIRATYFNISTAVWSEGAADTSHAIHIYVQDRHDVFARSHVLTLHSRRHLSSYKLEVINLRAPSERPKHREQPTTCCRIR